MHSFCQLSQDPMNTKDDVRPVDAFLYPSFDFYRDSMMLVTKWQPPSFSKASHGYYLKESLQWGVNALFTVNQMQHQASLHQPRWEEPREFLPPSSPAKPLWAGYRQDQDWNSKVLLLLSVLRVLCICVAGTVSLPSRGQSYIILSHNTTQESPVWQSNLEAAFFAELLILDQGRGEVWASELSFCLSLCHSFTPGGYNIHLERLSKVGLGTEKGDLRGK